ncbi:response regulator transcription factor [Treponema sp. OMZ 787]|uniref:response regulator transcription factor n=1 Tax=Treponema sp. OMZ 787 TaxID=2563669 RepID=UPI0020A2893B|nr:response regulator transcription factor [Treponema sp. OMZ 787]UTC63041.1 response regulator transcription factor [Treponema sp. OMZ 787]
MNKILIIEDDNALAEGLARALSGEYSNVETAYNLRKAQEKINEKKYDLIILDINLPDGNGFDFLSKIRNSIGSKIILLTANDMEADVVTGLELGADDYITKPFSLAVLRARVKNQLKKIESGSKIIKIDRYNFDFENMIFLENYQRIEISKTEQKLLQCLIKNAGITLTRDKLIDYIWSDDEYVFENALSVTVKRLRDKLHAYDYIKTVYGIGYMWSNNE